MIHIEVQPGAITTIEMVPPSAAFGPIETFLFVNSKEISAQDRATLREVAAKAIRDSAAPINTGRCPAHLQNAFWRLVEDARGSKILVDPKTEFLP
jgi:hypothetical protein